MVNFSVHFDCLQPAVPAEVEQKQLTLFVGSQDTMRTVSSYKSGRTEARLLAGGEEQHNSVHITCGWLRGEWAGRVLAALQSSVRQQKCLVLKTHTLEFPTLFCWRRLPNDSKCF